MSDRKAIATVRWQGGEYAVATRQQLDVLPCHKCGSAHEAPRALAARCHPEAGVEAFYFRGVMALRCAVCRQPLVAIPVADALPPATHYVGVPSHCPARPSPEAT